MANWYDMTEKELAEDEEASIARQLAYANTFFGTEESRLVLADMRRYIYQNSVGLEPLAILALVDFYERIRNISGLTDNREVIKAEASVLS